MEKHNGKTKFEDFELKSCPRQVPLKIRSFFSKDIQKQTTTVS